MTCATCTHPLACQNHGGCIDETEARLRKEREAAPVCPLGADCDLTVAWMLGREAAKDNMRALEEENAKLKLVAIIERMRKEHAGAGSSAVCDAIFKALEADQ